ncbi:D-alanyl-D-alanine carboxypeptidase [Desulfitobacterium dichloroeliminans LMG P-21439]|uniref:D-alanyl-D-alanine carboxypeptidase n=1 Tax=Desulfitobacterium dichloroeliminans (strain LMG P-21439 / DCA1) TaxID=871963 RepID=L0F635_DESDL|nr:serine hydrolase [Desulfitobacterium dichloroeliminans]AGA69299.1 D-alanyl-D-alanine carboxypeptidase [Desulfitobacterium dichloroeliminans LMG P-21439]
MNKNTKRRTIRFTTIIALAVIVLSFYPNLPTFSGLARTLQAQNTSELAYSASGTTQISAGNTAPKSTFPTNKVNDSSDPARPEDSSYLMVNLRTGERLLEKNKDIQRAPASTIKLLTGLVVYEKLQETEEVTVGKEVMVEGSVLGLKPGDKILVKDLITALYVASANDAANALAVAAYGTLENFIDKTNQYATQLGCTDTKVQTAHGLSAPQQYTTAQDLARIAAKFTQNPELMSYVKLKKSTIEWTDVNGWKQIREFSNTNQLLGVYPGDKGLKTGTTTEAGQCLVTYVTRGDGDLLLVLLGSDQRYQDTIELLDQGLAKIRTRSALKNFTNGPEAFNNTPGFFVP